MFDEWVYKAKAEKACGLLRRYLDETCYEVLSLFEIQTAEKERVMYDAEMRLFHGKLFHVHFVITEGKVGLLSMLQVTDDFESLMMALDHHVDELVFGDKAERVCGLLRRYLDGTCYDVLSLFRPESAEKERASYIAKMKLFEGEIFNVCFIITEEKVESLDIWRATDDCEYPAGID